ncbi:MAG: hypothetical protein H7Z42_06995 [Roseiflexaceae bacterium]|nr:hypothetical protein [Roseiflexaceae bacterium]
MRGRLFSTDTRLPEEDLFDLTDLLACRVFNKLGRRAFQLNRRDVAELIAPYIADLDDEDRRAVPWMLWDLIQEGVEAELETA